MTIKLISVTKYKCRSCGATAEETAFPDAFEIYPEGCSSCKNTFKRYKEKLDLEKLKTKSDATNR